MACPGQHGLPWCKKVAQLEAYSSRGRERSGSCIWHFGFMECYPRVWYLSHMTWSTEGEPTNFGCHWEKGECSNLISLEPENSIAIDRQQREQEITSACKRNQQVLLIVRMYAQVQRNFIHQKKTFSQALRVSSQYAWGWICLIKIQSI